MTDNHPITPPPELVEEWRNKWTAANGPIGLYLANQGARWGADQQLEQCVAWLDGYEHEGWAAEMMRNACRPKPPSLAEQALDAMRSMQIKPCIINGITVNAGLISKYNTMYNTIHRALERLQELEGGND